MPSGKGETGKREREGGEGRGGGGRERKGGRGRKGGEGRGGGEGGGEVEGGHKIWLQACRRITTALTRQEMFPCRKRWKDEVFGFNEGDDVDCLFFILARSMTDQQKGTCSTQNNNV